MQAGGALAKLSPRLLATLDAILPKTWSRANPIDIIGDATPERYAATMEAVTRDPHGQRHPGDELPHGARLFHRRGGSRDRLPFERHKASGDVRAISPTGLEGLRSQTTPGRKFHAASIPSYNPRATRSRASASFGNTRGARGADANAAARS